jgi:hypothetical protein|nr:MAG: hypothetical protein [Bacteriophage sp.]
MKNIMSDKTYRIVKVVIMIIALVLGFLYVLNGRYVRVSENRIIDTWTEEYYNVRSNEVIKIKR